MAEQVRALGMVPYVAERDDQPGNSLLRKLQVAIDDSVAFVAVLTAGGQRSVLVQQEIPWAVKAWQTCPRLGRGDGRLGIGGNAGGR